MKLHFTERTVRGKKVASLRADGRTPVVCYGGNQESGVYSVRTKDLLSVLSSDDVVIETEGDIPGKQVLIQEVVRHPVFGGILHADFLFVDAKHAVEHEVPVRLEGEAGAVKTGEGQILVALDRITVRALPQNIPSFVVADISSLASVGSHISASDLPLPDTVTLVTSPDEIVVSVVERSQEEDVEHTDEEYLSNIEVTGKGGKKKDGEADEVPDA